MTEGQQRLDIGALTKRLPEVLRLAVQVLPFAFGAAAAKLVFSELGWETVPLNPLYTGLLAGNVFLLGFLLAGTLSDYKESEKLPGDLAGSVETIADECLILYRDKRASAAQRCLEHLSVISRALRDWFRGRETSASVFERISELNGFFHEFEPLTQPNFIVRLKQEQSSLRRMVIRINTIRETSFVGAGYAIAAITTLLLVVGLLVADFGPAGLEVFLIWTIAFILVYMLLLVRDLDNPFDYNGDDQIGAAEVSLQPLDSLEQRLTRMLAGVGSEEASPVP